jgi:hypothetical protein
MVSLKIDDQRIKYSDSPVADSESEAPSLSAEISPPTSEKHFYFPCGRLLSNPGSLFDTDEDISEKASPKGRHLSGDDSQRFMPEGDKIINYEVISPTSEAGHFGHFLNRRASGFEEGSSSDDSRRPTVIQGISASSPEMFEEFYPGKQRMSQTQNLSRTIALEHELERLRKKLEENTSELHRVKQVLDKNLKDKETNTLDEDDELEMCNEINELRMECLRYERQNEELRLELQYSAQDLSESELTNRQLNKEFIQLKERTEIHEDEMKECIRLMSEMLGNESAYGFDESDDFHHLSNFLSSKVEIAKSRLSRLKTKYELSASETKRLQAENEKYRKLMKSLAQEHAKSMAGLKQQLKASEAKVCTLEKNHGVRAVEYKREVFPVKPFNAGSIRIPAKSELDYYIDKVKAENTRSPRSAESSSHESMRSSVQDSYKSAELNESTREASVVAKHTKVISFTDELEGDKEQTKAVVKASISPDRKTTAPKVVQKYMLQGRSALPRHSNVKSGKQPRFY